MNALGIKSNRRSIQQGIKQLHSGHSIGNKLMQKTDNISSSVGNANISQQDSNIIDPTKMVTGIDKNSNHHHRNQSGLEKR